MPRIKFVFVFSQLTHDCNNLKYRHILLETLFANGACDSQVGSDFVKRRNIRFQDLFTEATISTPNRMTENQSLAAKATSEGVVSEFRMKLVRSPFGLLLTEIKEFRSEMNEINDTLAKHAERLDNIDDSLRQLLRDHEMLNLRSLVNQSRFQLMQKAGVVNQTDEFGT